MQEEYSYAVARIRCKERELLTSQKLESLASASGFDACMRILSESGWGDGTQMTAEALLAQEQERLWALIDELVADRSVFDALLLPADYNLLKAAIKSTGGQEDMPALPEQVGIKDPEIIRKAVAEKNFVLLGDEHMAEAARDAHRIFLETADGQLCDARLDQACMTQILRSGQKSKVDALAFYAEWTVAVTNIKIAARCCKTKKLHGFIKSALAPCSTLDVGELAAASAREMSALYDYLSHTRYSGAVDSLKLSFSAFEKWCDDQMMDRLKNQKSNPFTLGPIFAYVVARLTEMRMVRIILSAKLNGLDMEKVKERQRVLYV